MLKKHYRYYFFTFFVMALILQVPGCTKKMDLVVDPPIILVEGVDYFLPHIDLSHWKVTLPIGPPTEVTPPAILDYASSELLAPYFYNDSTDGSLVFYTVPGESTPNSSYSRTELREQLDPGSNTTNWTFEQGGRLKGRLAMDDISRDAQNNYHRAIIMQIHGRLTDAQRDLIDEDDNNAPPVLKIYWTNGKIRVARKVLKDLQVSDVDILRTDAWKDESAYFDEEVGFDPFDLEIIASDGRMVVTLNDDESMIFEDVHMQRWGVFENYFKAGNYLITRDKDAFSRVKYYALQAFH